MLNICRAVILGFLFAVLAGCQSVSVMTYNIRLDVAVDGENAWPHRKDFLVSQLQNHSPDIFGTQEGLPHQIAYIDEQMAKHDYIGTGRDGGSDGEYSAIFYNRDRFSVEQEATFWLSETPQVKSMGWDAAFPRICTYGLFVDRRSRDKIWVFNTHLDHIGGEARKNGVRLILEKISEVNTDGHPVILMGDFNAEPASDLMTGLSTQMDDAKAISRSAATGPDGTFNVFQYDTPAARRIDYIVLSKSSGIVVKSYAVLDESRQSRYPSDHFPVLVKLELR